MKLLAMSDTHGNFPTNCHLKTTDVLVHCGDITSIGTREMVVEAAQWFQSINASTRILVPGNHDWMFYRKPRRAIGIFDKTHVLINKAIVVEGLHFYGMPYTIPFMNWAFYEKEPRLAEMCAQIPYWTNILISHGPPYGLNDQNEYREHCGSVSVRDWVNASNISLHLYGHIHEGYGMRGNNPIEDTHLSVNCSIAGAGNRVRNNAILFDIRKENNGKVNISIEDLVKF